MKRLLTLCPALALSVLCAAGIVHGVRAGVAQWMYERAKYGRDRENLSANLALCESAHRLYPHNYYFCLWAAEQSYYAGDKPGQAADCRAAAERWCERGAGLNPYNRALRILRARLMGERSPALAAADWARYVDWQFWEPYNHALLVEFYAQAGDVERALAELDWVRGSPYFAEARLRVMDAWEREKQFTVTAGTAPAPRSR